MLRKRRTIADSGPSDVEIAWQLSFDVNSVGGQLDDHLVKTINIAQAAERRMLGTGRLHKQVGRQCSMLFVRWASQVVVRILEDLTDVAGSAKSTWITKKQVRVNNRSTLTHATIPTLADSAPTDDRSLEVCIDAPSEESESASDRR